MQLNLHDTIAAIATPIGVSATGTIRVSGDKALELVSQVFKGKDLAKQDGYTMHFGRIMADNGDVIDEVVAGVFKAPKSYTGENVVELSCHGSPYVLQRVLERLLEVGIRQAGPGEFTKRAFLNGKLDLSMAEAVGDLIVSESKAAHHSAIYQLKGGISEKIRALREELVSFTSLLELELDFAEEDVEFANRDKFLNLLSGIEAEVEKLINSFGTGKMIKEGVTVAIVGRPNAGKSTLLNALLDEERAIVSDIEGTTRDYIEDTASIKGFLFRFIDTAGLRETGDEIETIGIARALEKAKGAHLIIYLFDANKLSIEDVKADLAQFPDALVLAIGNKTDLLFEKPKNLEIDQIPVHYLSSKNDNDVEELKDFLLSQLGLETENKDFSHITNARHYQALQSIKSSIQSVLNGFKLGLSSEFVVQDIRLALDAMGEITGEVTNDEILGTIFSKFCIGNE
ncbi:MAG: tRNA uridine-5-carboxymethylaminomethyl(34) synthesis GTPase MnmE [Bacteroidetes bacterium]|nr:tRNA uridine-5-carboxymethylaminomethyl(34) synthesis GTPase MnmE [Bacteroidota bacterium]